MSAKPTGRKATNREQAAQRRPAHGASAMEKSLTEREIRKLADKAVAGKPEHVRAS